MVLALSLPARGWNTDSSPGAAAKLPAEETSRTGSTSEETEAVEVGRVIDGFHEAAAEGDEEMYFGFLAADAVFLGSDAEERWTKEEFRAWAAPHFEEAPAWTFEPRERHIVVPARSGFAWFDEKLDSTGYGEWRGSGVLRRIDGEWRITHYNLTVPIPNDLLHEVVVRIEEEKTDAAPRADTRIFIVRHAEKEIVPGNPDPPLSAEGRKRAARLGRMLSRAGLNAAYATEYRRTRETVATAAATAGIEPVVTDALETDELARMLKSRHEGETVLVSGHSNTVPALIAALGVNEKIVINSGDYSDIFLVTLSRSGTAGLVILGYGD